MPNAAWRKSALYEALAGHQTTWMPALPGRTNHLPSGILVPLLWEPELTIFLTSRSQELRHHPGEVCFPGGRVDPEDEDLEATALREADEELGITEAKVVGKLSSVPLYSSDFRVTPFVAEIAPGDYKPQSNEVDELLAVAALELLARPNFDALPFTAEGQTSLSPIFTLDEHVVFGATAHVLHELLQISARAWGMRLPTLKVGRYVWTDILPNNPPPD